MKWISVKDELLKDIEGTVFVAWLPQQVYAAVCENSFTGLLECPECGKPIENTFTHYIRPQPPKE